MSDEARRLWVVEHLGHDGRWHTSSTDAWLSREFARDSADEAEMNNRGERRVTEYIPASALQAAVEAERERCLRVVGAAKAVVLAGLAGLPSKMEREIGAGIVSMLADLDAALREGE